MRISCDSACTWCVSSCLQEVIAFRQKQVCKLAMQRRASNWEREDDGAVDCASGKVVNIYKVTRKQSDEMCQGGLTGDNNNSDSGKEMLTDGLKYLHELHSQAYQRQFNIHDNVNTCAVAVRFNSCSRSRRFF